MCTPEENYMFWKEKRKSSMTSASKTFSIAMFHQKLSKNIHLYFELKYIIFPVLRNSSISFFPNDPKNSRRNGVPYGKK